MPRNGSGVYSAPAGTTGTPNTIIDSAKYNAFVADLTNDLNLARPIVAGGTGATTKSGAQQALDLEPGVDIQAYNAKLAALAALTLAADKLIYATGTDTLATSDLTAFARTLLAEVDAAGMRGELGLGGMAVKDDVAIGDIDATGTADGTTRLAGDGTWKRDKVRQVPVATTSGSAIDFTGIPTDVTEIDLTLLGVSLSGTDNFLIQLLDGSGNPITTGYRSTTSNVYSGATTTGSTAGFIAVGGQATNENDGVMRLRRVPGADTWTADHTLRNSSTSGAFGFGMVNAGGNITGIRLTRTGSNTFDAGSAYVEYR